MDDEYIIVARLPALTQQQLEEVLRAITDYDMGDAQIVVVPDELRRKALSILEAI